MPLNQYVAPYQQSGSPNVPITESTGGQLQGTMGSEGLIENSSYSGTVAAAPFIITDNVVASGNLSVNGQTIITTAVASGGGTPNFGIVITGTSQQSGSAPGFPAVVWGSGANTVNAGQGSGGALNSPAGFFFINTPTSGTPWMKVPFYNS